MEENFLCPFCGKKLALDRKWLGREVQCPYCNSVFLFKDEMIDRAISSHALPSDLSSTGRRQASRDADSFDAKPIGFWARVAAALIDSIVTLAATIVAAMVVGFFVGVIGGDAQFFGKLIALCTSWLYCSLMESSDMQATLGKLAVGAKVVNAEGKKISFGRATGRHFAKYLSAFLLCVGYILVAFDDRKRGLHDMIAGTYVISRH